MYIQIQSLYYFIIVSSGTYVLLLLSMQTKHEAVKRHLHKGVMWTVHCLKRHGEDTLSGYFQKQAKVHVLRIFSGEAQPSYLGSPSGWFQNTDS